MPISNDAAGPGCCATSSCRSRVLLARDGATGIAADVEHLAHLEAHLAAEVKRAPQAAYDAVGHEFNLGSPKQLQGILFDELGLPKTKKIKTGYTTDADALAWLRCRATIR